MSDAEIQLGATYKDLVSGYTGVATNKTQFLFGCERVGLQNGHDDKGDPVVAVFDAPQLEMVKSVPSKVQKALESAQSRVPVSTGGDRPRRSAEQ